MLAAKAQLQMRRHQGQDRRERLILNQNLQKSISARGHFSDEIKLSRVFTIANILLAAKHYLLLYCCYQIARASKIILIAWRTYFAMYGVLSRQPSGGALC